ncbi:hypothetical protein [Cohnella nanjingensis]|nr:hypothetical protein [Cohnella nanjingensis]
MGVDVAPLDEILVTLVGPLALLWSRRLERAADRKAVRPVSLR